LKYKHKSINIKRKSNIYKMLEVMIYKKRSFSKVFNGLQVNV